PRYRDEPSYQVVADTMSRLWKALGVDAPARAMLRSGASDVYAYRFDWRGERDILGTDLKGMLGAAHALELPFVFGHFDMGPLNVIYDNDKSGERARLSETMMKLWGTFAREGKPGAPWTPAPRTLLLNLASAGGVEMSDVHEVLEDIVTGVDT